jgi:hypothetical protein
VLDFLRELLTLGGVFVLSFLFVRFGSSMLARRR